MRFSLPFVLVGVALLVGGCDSKVADATGNQAETLVVYRDGCDEAACGARIEPPHPCAGGYAVSVCTTARGACSWQVDCASEPPPGEDSSRAVSSCDVGGGPTCGAVPSFDEKDCVYGFLGEPQCESWDGAACAWTQRCRPQPCEQTGTCNTLDRSKLGETCGIDKPCPEGATCASISVNVGEYVPPTCILGDPCSALTCAAGRGCAILESYPAQLVCSR